MTSQNWVIFRFHDIPSDSCISHYFLRTFFGLVCKITWDILMTNILPILCKYQSAFCSFHIEKKSVPKILTITPVNKPKTQTCSDPRVVILLCALVSSKRWKSVQQLSGSCSQQQVPGEDELYHGVQATFFCLQSLGLTLRKSQFHSACRSVPDSKTVIFFFPLFTSLFFYRSVPLNLLRCVLWKLLDYVTGGISKK